MFAETFEPRSILDIEAVEVKNPYGPSPTPLVFTHEGPWELTWWEQIVKRWDAYWGAPKPRRVPEATQLAARGV